MKDKPLLWIAGSCGVGVLVGSIFSGSVGAVLYYLAQTIAYRPFLFLLIVLIGTGLYGWVIYSERQEVARTKTTLSDAEKQSIKIEVEHNLTTRKHEISRLETKINASRDRLRDMTVKSITNYEKLHNELTEFIWFVDHVNELIERRSEKLKKSLPKNPVDKSKLLKRDQKMRDELNKTVEMIRSAFPSLAGSIPPPRETPILPSGQVPDSSDSIEVLELKKEAERLSEYQTVSQQKGRVTKH